MMHKAWSSIEEVPYCFSGSSVKLQGHTAQKIVDLNPIWVRLLGWSQLSNPSDLPCCGIFCNGIISDTQLYTKSYELCNSYVTERDTKHSFEWCMAKAIPGWSVSLCSIPMCFGACLWAHTISLYIYGNQADKHQSSTSVVVANYTEAHKIYNKYTVE